MGERNFIHPSTTGLNTAILLYIFKFETLSLLTLPSQVLSILAQLPSSVLLLLSFSL